MEFDARPAAHLPAAARSAGRQRGPRPGAPAGPAGAVAGPRRENSWAPSTGSCVACWRRWRTTAANWQRAQTDSTPRCATPLRCASAWWNASRSWWTRSAAWESGSRPSSKTSVARPANACATRSTGCEAVRRHGGNRSPRRTSPPPPRTSSFAMRPTSSPSRPRSCRSRWASPCATRSWAGRASWRKLERGKAQVTVGGKSLLCKAKDLTGVRP